ncbi:hypothetical protein [Pseudomonas sp. Irchel 3A5]|uniref:hypothetical protein n=1 Tax=Pseudomonas sp. Irchel 3A5 TaxID=2008911 RepID=UPI000BA2D75D|nr:hypothetical protein [Pseudomonas sp. Irchel 3A5]
MESINNNAVRTGHNLFSFSGVSSAQRNDIIDMLMFADCRATQVWRPQSQWTSWINYYRSHVVSAGCQLKSLLVKQPMVINSAHELDNISVEVAGSIRVSGLMDLVRRSFRATQFNEQARHFFDSGIASGYFSTFQVVPCVSAGEDDVSILICGLHASATVSSDSRGGGLQVNREMVVRLAGGVYNFNSEAFAPHRQRIQARLLEVGRFNLEQLSL